MEMYILLALGIVLVLFGAWVLVKLSDKAGNRVGAGLPLIALGIVTMTLAATLSNNRLPSLSQIQTQPPIMPAPSPAPAPAPTREGAFVGASENQIAVSITIKGNRATGYLCDGNKIEAWLEGTVTGDQVNLFGKKGATLTGTLSTTSSSTRGTVTINSKELQYYAEMAQKPAGLYEGRGNVDGVDNRIGWIVFPGGSQVGIRNVNGERSPAPRLDLSRLKADGLQIPVKPVDGDDDVVLGQ